MPFLYPMSNNMQGYFSCNKRFDFMDGYGIMNLNEDKREG